MNFNVFVGAKTQKNCQKLSTFNNHILYDMEMIVQVIIERFWWNSIWRPRINFNFFFFWGGGRKT